MRRQLTWVAWVLTALVLSAGCGKKRPSKPRRRPDAAVARPRPAPPGAVTRRPGALAALLNRVPARSRWYVGLGRPGALLDQSARYWRMLSQVPELTAPMARVAASLKKTLGAWPPPRSWWRSVGIDPGGGVVVAGVGPGGGPVPGNASGTLILVASDSPETLFRWLVGKTGSSATTPTHAALVGGERWWCGRLPGGAACGSDRTLVAELLGPRPSARPPLGAPGFVGPSWRDADLVAGWRSGDGAPLSTALARFRGWGLEAEVRLLGEPLVRWLDWLAPAAAVPAPAADAVAAAWVRLDTTRIRTLVGQLLPDAIRGSVVGAPTPHTLLNQCTGEAMVVVGPGGWSLRAKRRGPAAGFPPVPWLVNGWSLWAWAPRDRLVLADGVDVARKQPSTAPVGVAPPLQRLFSRRASAAARIPLMDPLEPLTAEDRVRLLAALVGLPAGERALVGLIRGLLTLLGVAGLSVERTSGGAVVRLVFVSPAAPLAPGRMEFERLWRAKWQGGGFFDRRALSLLATRRPQQVLGQLARGLTELRFSAASSRLVTDWLLARLGELAGPEVSCASLAAHMTRCLEPFSRLREPRRWAKLERLMLPEYRKRLRRSVLEDARREAAALGAHCDRLGGRLENAVAVKRCLALDGCEQLARCLVRAFRP